MKIPVSVANKRLTVRPSPLDATHTQNMGGGSRLWLTRHASEPPGSLRLRRPDVPNVPNVQTMLQGYLLMSSFASSRLSKGCRKGLVWSGAPLIACVISLAAVGKSPLFDEIRASARWLIQ